MLSLRATASPTSKGAPLLVQRHTSTGWVTVGTVRMSAVLHASYRVPTAKRGTYLFRFVVAATSAHLAGVSNVVTVVVK